MVNEISKDIEITEVKDKIHPVKMVMFNTKSYDKLSLDQLMDQYANIGVEIEFIEEKLNEKNAVYAKDSKIVCAFVNDSVNAATISALNSYGVQLIAMRCAGFNNVDITAANQYTVSVARVPAYSPYSVAEHAVGLMIVLNRKIHLAYNRTRMGDFSLGKNLVGFDMHGKTVGVFGTGKIGKILINILLGFGCNILCFDIYRDKELLTKPNVKYLDTVNEVFEQSDIISIHSPLTKETQHLVNDNTIGQMKNGVIIINTSRGGLIDNDALIRGLKSGKIGAAGLDVVEGEENYFFENWSDRVITDDSLSRLLTFNNVIVTAHQAFFTNEALTAIANTTFNNVKEWISGKRMTEMTNTVNNL